eukprot:1381749-Amorphochlora_amoeboformis.AAC.2
MGGDQRVSGEAQVDYPGSPGDSIIIMEDFKLKVSKKGNLNLSRTLIPVPASMHGTTRRRGRRPCNPCSRGVIRLIIIATVLTTACVSSLQATVLSFDGLPGWGREKLPGGPHPVEVGTLPGHRPIATADEGLDKKMVARGDELSPCSPDHPNSIKGTGLFLSLQELDPDAVVTDYFDAQSCEVRTFLALEN